MDTILQPSEITDLLKFLTDVEDEANKMKTKLFDGEICNR